MDKEFELNHIKNISEQILKNYEKQIEKYNQLCNLLIEENKKLESKNAELEKENLNLRCDLRKMEAQHE